MVLKRWLLSLLIFILILILRCTTTDQKTNLVPIAKGWAKNSINTVIFRRNSLVSDGNTQYAAFYGEDAHVYLAKRKHGQTNWKIEKTRYTGDVEDAHNTISIMEMVFCTWPGTIMVICLITAVA